MVNPFICGSGSLRHQLEKEDEDDYTQCSTPRNLTPKKSRKTSLSRSRDNKNPYTKLGREKFSALLAEIEDKKQMIYTQYPSDDISLIWFTYSDTDTIKPIVIKARDKRQESKIKNGKEETGKIMVNSKEVLEKHHIESSTLMKEAKQGMKNTMKNNFSFKKIKIDSRKAPSFYLPAILILVLIFLAFSGKTFAILCTSVGWYLVPTIKKGRSYSKREDKKNEYTRRFSEKKIRVTDWLSSPNTDLTVAPTNDVLFPKIGRRWRSC